MSEFMKFESTKSIRRWRPPKGTAGLERSRVSGCRRSPRPPAMIIARTRGRRGISSARGRRPGPEGIEIREAEILAIEPAQRLGGFRRQRRAPGQRARDLGQPLELGV